MVDRWRLNLAGLTTAVVVISIVLVAWGPSARGAHIPATGPLPSNCVEFQVNTLGTKSPSTFPDVEIAVSSWDDGSESHEVSFDVSGLAWGQYVDLSVKSGTNVQEPGPYGNGSHTFDNEFQNAISHIRVCVFVEGTTTTTEGPTTTVDGSTTTLGEPTTTRGESTTTTMSTTTTSDGSTTTTGATTTTTRATTTTVEDEVLGTVITTSTTQPSDPATPSTVSDEVAGITIVADRLPFTGFEAETLGWLALVLLALGMLTLAAVRSARASEDE